MRKALEIVINILTSIMFVVLAIIIVGKIMMLTSGDDHFEIFGYSIFNVATGSMEPAISQNDIILVKKTNDINVEDIITYKKDNAYITHRVISVNDNSVVTKGDANNTNDAAVDKALIVGKVIKIYSNAGVWQKIMTNPSIVVMVCITMALFSFAFSYNVKDEVKVKEVKKVEKTDELTKETLKEINEEIDNSVEKDKLEYTMGIDLMEIQKKIDSKIDKGE